MNSTDTAPPARLGLHHRLYNWVLHWAYTPYAIPALLLLAFAESSFFPIPPDVLLLPLCLGQPKRSLRFASWCSVASVVGGIAGYWLGFGLWEAGLREICFDYIPGFTPEKFETVRSLYDAWGFAVVFIAGFTPIPYKIFTISAGVFSINFPLFVLASMVGRSARFFLVAYLIKKFGAPVRDFIERRLGLMTILFCALLIGGFAIVKYAL